MSNRVEVDRADLEAVCNWWRGVGYDECAAAIKRIRELLEPPRCEGLAHVPGLLPGETDGSGSVRWHNLRCVLPKGHHDWEYDPLDSLNHNTLQGSNGEWSSPCKLCGQALTDHWGNAHQIDPALWDAATPTKLFSQTDHYDQHRIVA